MPDRPSLKAWITDKSKEVGFHQVGFTHAHSHDFASELSDYLSNSYQGEMNWLAERQTWRTSPSTLWPDARTIIILAERYLPPEDNPDPEKGTIASYALGRDYHDVVKKRLKKLGRELVAHTGAEIKVFVDTAPVMEKPLAQAAGLGWQGKHGNLLSRELGNWFFLGAIFTTLELEPDTPSENHCGTCSACIDACPTNAFDERGYLDPRRCISYLTIESKDVIPLEFRKNIGNLIYGCDICLNACPWNKFSGEDVDPKLAPVPDRTHPDLDTLLQMDETDFRQFFAGSPIKRIGWAKFISNCLIAAGNANSPKLHAHIENFLTNPLPIIQESAKWAHDEIKMRQESRF